MSRTRNKSPDGEPVRTVGEEATTSPDDVPDAGTGERVKQLEMFDPVVARMYQRVHSQRCEKRVQKVTRDNPHTGIRLAKAIPPYLKWPIWPAKPRRPKDVPASYEALQRLLDEPKSGRPYSVPARSFNLTSIPRMMGQVAYIGGELGPKDRRTLVVLTAAAVERGPQSDRGNYIISSPDLIDRLGISKRSNRNAQEVPGSIWRLSGTLMRLASGDPLSGSWGTETFSLMPTTRLIKDGRLFWVEYDLPAPAKALIEQGKLCTVDLDRLRALSSPAAESLYCLLYDVAQWSHKTHVEYPTPELAERLGLSLSKYRKGGKEYVRWGPIIEVLRRASREVYLIAQFLVDFDVRGSSGVESSMNYFFADGLFRKGHLPPHTRV